MVAIGLQKSYAKIKLGNSCTSMIFVDLQMVVVNRIEIPGRHFQDQNNKQ
jgi:hypothetical protein